MGTFQSLTKGGNNGAVIVRGDVENSELYKHIRGTSQPHIPFDGRLDFEGNITAERLRRKN